MTHHRPVTVAEIADLLARLRTLRTPARGGDPATYTAALAAKAGLLARIAAEQAIEQTTEQARETSTTDTAKDIR